MICNVRQNTIDNLKKKGLVDDNMKIISTEFGLYNDKYSKIAKDKYGVTNADKLFTVDIQQIPILYPTGNRENFRQGSAYAVMNDEFFDELQELHNEYHKDSDASAYYQLLNDEMSPIIEKEDVKEDPEEFFRNNFELQSIGNSQQYSAYLDTVFPNSQVNNIFYHGTNDKNFQPEKRFVAHRSRW